MILKIRLLNDLKYVGIPIDFNLVIKPFSKRYNGRYDPNSRTVILYRYEDSECTIKIDYNTLLETLVHEAVHHYQWVHDINFKREKGTMHDSNFYYIYNKWIERLTVKVG